MADLNDSAGRTDACFDSTEFFRTFVESSPDVIMRFDSGCRHTYVNPSVQKVVDIPPEKFIGRTHHELGFDEDLCKIWEEAIKEVFRTKTPLEREFSLDTGRESLTFNWRLIPEFDNKGAVAAVMSIARDITVHRTIERNLALVFDQMTSGFALHEIILDNSGTPVDYRFLEVNPAFEQITGLSASEIYGKTVLQIMPDLERSWIETYGKVALSGEPARFENYSGVLGKHFDVVAFSPQRGQFACLFTDITEGKKVQDELRESRETFRTLVEFTESVHWEFDLEADMFTYVSPQAEKITGYPGSVWKGLDSWAGMIYEKDRDWAVNYCVNKTQKGKDHEFVYRMVRADGAVRWIRDIVKVITREEKPVKIIGIMFDITDLKTSILEKEVLLKELHHRVKNNMAVISSLLSLQMAEIDDPEYRQMFDESRMRIRSMALVHEKLYRSEDFVHIDIGEYVESLIQSITDMFFFGRNMETEIDIDAIPIEIDTLIPCGLIINELITNSFKHAFKGQDDPLIGVSIKQHTTEEVTLTVCDNGPGGVDIENQSGLGLRLVKTLVMQISGRLRYKDGPGALFTVTFPAVYGGTGKAGVPDG